MQQQSDHSGWQYTILFWNEGGSPPLTPGWYSTEDETQKLILAARSDLDPYFMESRTKALNIMGREGWELVLGDEFNYYCLKRPSR